MAVAKSFQGMIILTEPYEKNRRKYVKVKNPKTNAEREVRWYTDAEYAKMYPEDKSKVEDPYYKPQKQVFGFEKGFITIFEGDIPEEDEWFRASKAEYNLLWGWFFKSKYEVPADLPLGVKPIVLTWAQVGNEDGSLYPFEKVIAIANELRFSKISNSNWIGEINDRLDLDLVVIAAKQVEDYLSTKIHHEFEDAEGNVFVWITQAKNYAVGTTHKLKATIKDHITEKGIKKTILTRCFER